MHQLYPGIVNSCFILNQLTKQLQFIFRLKQPGMKYTLLLIVACISLIACSKTASPDVIPQVPVVNNGPIGGN